MSDAPKSTTPATIPDEVRHALQGEPMIDEMDVVTFFVTANADGVPIICLLSRRQLAIGSSELSALIRSRRTLANLDAAKRAALHVISVDTAWTIHLQLIKAAPARPDGAVPASFNVVGVEADRVAEKLEPARYLATKRLMDMEGPAISVD